MTMRIVNLTPHTLVIFDEHGPFVEKAPDGPAARVEGPKSAIVVTPTDMGDLPMVAVAYTEEVSGLPDPRPETRYVVSRVTAAALIGRRDDVLFPDEEVRDDAGKTVIGCRALGRFVPLSEIAVTDSPTTAELVAPAAQPTQE